MQGDKVQNPREAVISLLIGAAPEREADIRDLWLRYDPSVSLVPDGNRITMQVRKAHIEFDGKALDALWLIGFSGWRALECYVPPVVCSPVWNQPVATLLAEDHGLDDVERTYKERLSVAQRLIDSADVEAVPWPPDIPQPTPNRSSFQDAEATAAFDLTALAVAFVILHEFRHVMYDREGVRPDDPKEEELACDVWAREFMTVKLGAYARENNHLYQDVLSKRSMGLALAALMLHEITPIWGRSGSDRYFSIKDRIEALLDNTALPEGDKFWVFTASLLIGIYRQRGTLIAAPPLAPPQLVRHLLDGL